MTAQSRSTLIARFQTGDVPVGSDFEDMIDSFVATVDTSVQTITSHVTFSGGAAVATLTAADIKGSAATFTGTVAISALQASAATFLGGITVSGTTTAEGAIVAKSTLSVSGVATFTGAVTADAALVAKSTFSASGASTLTGAVTMAGGVTVSGSTKQTTVTITALGSTQGSAASLGAGFMYRVAQATAGENAGIIIPTTAGGRQMMIVNATNTAVNLYPPSGGQINNGGANAPVTVTASSAVLIGGATSALWFAWRTP